MTVKLLTILRDLEKIMKEEGYEPPTSIGLTITGAKILRGELKDMITRQQPKSGDRCWFHNIEIIAPEGFDWRAFE